MSNGTGNDKSKADNKHKDSCQYSVEISKQFLTLASAGIAFVIGLAMSRNTTVPGSYYWAVGFLVTSVAIGLFYVMSVVAHINQDGNYDVYTCLLRWLAALQIFIFFIAIFVLGFVVLNEAGRNKQTLGRSNLALSIGSRTFKYRIPTNSIIKIHLLDKDKFDFEISIEP